MKIQRRLRLFVVVVFILTMLPVGVFANPGGSPFKDVSINHWGLQHIFKMERRGVINGYGDGEFKPNKTVSQLEAVVMAVRAMGLEEESKMIDTSVIDEWQLNLPASWNADSYVAMAIKKGLIEQENFNPNSDATRAWVAVLVIKMIGSEEEIIEYLKTDFYDDYIILPRAKGYVALAAKKGIVTGFNDSEGHLIFDPNTSVTRAQLATMISRSDNYMQDVDGQLPLGKIIGINDDKLTILNQNNETVTYPYMDQIHIFNLEGKRLNVSDLQTGIIVRYALNDQQAIDFIEFADNSLWEEKQHEIKGTITQHFIPDRLLTIKNEEGKLVIYQYAESVKVTDNNSNQLKVTDLNIGNEVVLTLDNDNTIVSIELTPQSANEKVEGNIYSIDFDSRIITLKNNDQYFAYSLAEQVYVEYEGIRFPSLKDLQKGDQVKLNIENNQVTSIQVIQPTQFETLNGKIINLSEKDTIITVRLEDDSLKAYEVSEQAIIFIKGKEEALFTDLKVNDMIRFTVENGMITSMEVTNREIINELTGVVKSIDTVNGYLTIEINDGELKTFAINQYVKIDGVFRLLDIKVGMKVTINLKENIIYSIFVKTTVEGIFVEIDNNNTFITVETEDNEETYLLADNVDVDLIDKSPSLTDLEAGQTIVLTFENEVVKNIDIMVTRTNQLTAIDTVRNRITVKTENKKKTYLLPSSSEVTVPDISNATIKDLQIGDTVKLTFRGNILTVIEVIPPNYGKIKSIESYRDRLVMTTASGESQIDLNKPTKVYNSENIQISFANLQINDYIQVVKTEDEIIITQADIVSGKFIGVNGEDGKIYITSEEGLYDYYYLSANVRVVKGATEYYLGDLQTDDYLTLYLFNDRVVEIRID